LVATAELVPERRIELRTY